MEIIAHRGASFDAPENSLSSFKLGYRQNADGDELDIYQTKDGRIVVSHDANTLRTGGVSNLISAMTYEQLRGVDVGKWGKWAGKEFAEADAIKMENAGIPVFATPEQVADALGIMYRHHKRVAKEKS